MLKLNKNIKIEIKNYCDKSPKERIGVVVMYNRKQVFRHLANQSDCDIMHYMADPQQFYDELKDTVLLSGKKKIKCFVHSHPKGIDKPSSTDKENAYHNYYYLIYHRNGFSWFMVNEKGTKTGDLK